jgi:hypothetical protein
MDSSEQHAHIINNFENIYYGAPDRRRRSTRWSFVLGGTYRMAVREMSETLGLERDRCDGLSRGRPGRKGGRIVRSVCRHVGIAVPLRKALEQRAVAEHMHSPTEHRHAALSTSSVLLESANAGSARNPRAGPRPRETVLVARRADPRALAERKQKLAKYFTEPPDPRVLTTAYVMLCVGGTGIAASAALFATTSTPVFGGTVLWCAAALVLTGFSSRARYLKERDAAQPRPADVEMDHVLAADLLDIAGTALHRMGLHLDDLALTGGSWDPIAHLEGGRAVLTAADRRPLLVFGPHHPARTAMGRDGVWRFSAYGVMVICPTGHNLGLYSCVLDLLTGTTSSEQAHQYHYDDVVAVSTITTQDDEEEHPLDLRFEREFPFGRSFLQELRIVISSGDRRCITVGVAQPDGTGRAPVQSSGIEEVIADVRRVLRDKKGTKELHLY